MTRPGLASASRQAAMTRSMSARILPGSMSSHHGVVIACALVVFGGACSKASDESDTKQWQSPPPPKAIAVPPGLAIPVAVDGGAHAAITTALLRATKPDFVD